MRAPLVKVVALVVALCVGGCLNATFLSNKPPGNVVYLKHPFFLGGLIGEAIVDVGQICADGVQSVRTFWGGVDIVLTIVTVGIYSPRTTEVVCAGPSGGGGMAPPAYAIHQDADGTVLSIERLSRDLDDRRAEVPR